MNDTSSQETPCIKVLGVGNLLWADEGFGVRCVEALDREWELPPDVEVLDGGTLGLALVPLLLDATHVLLFDAVAHGGEPGTLIVARDGEVPALISANKMSVHQVGMNDILASLELLGHQPQCLTVIGVKPVQLRERSGGPAREVVFSAIARELYESGRPPPEVACRTGDERFLALRARRNSPGDEPDEDAG